MGESESLPEALSQQVLQRIVETLSLKEAHGAEGGPFIELRSVRGGEPVGTVRVFEGAPLDHVTTVRIVQPAIGLDSHMIFAFSDPGSALPHFTVDAVEAGGVYAFHLDLIPRVDIGAELDWLNGVLQPLTPAWESGRKIPGLSEAKLSPRQLSLMSPWMLAKRADAAAFRAISEPVNAYLGHWLALQQSGLPAQAQCALSPAALRDRDARNRAAIFNADVDPVWNQLAPLIGEEMGERLRELLKSQRS